MEKNILEDITRKKIVDISKYVKGNKCKMLLVPKIDKILRIKVVKDFEGIHGTHVLFGGNEYVFSKEERDLEKCPGVLISCWINSKVATVPQLSLKEGKRWIDSYGKGFGSRTGANSVSMNVYLDERMSGRPHPSPFVSKDEVHLMQYGNANFKQHVMRASILKPVNRLLTGVVCLAKQVNAPLMSLIGESCTKGIATSGIMYSNGKSSRIYLYGFANSSHVDNKDKLSGKTLQHAKNAIEEMNSTCLKEAISYPEFGLPTTCGYQVLGESRDAKYSQYFCLGGLGIAVAIEHGSTHHFMGSMFKHNTGVAVLYHSNGNISIGAADPSILTFAWGKAGGSEQYKKKQMTPGSEVIEAETIDRDYVTNARA